jgi:dihydrofolate reductase
VVTSVDKALALGSREAAEVFVFGGAAIYAAALPATSRLYLTRVDAEYPSADVYFPAFDDFTVEVASESHTDDDLEYTYQTLDRPA